MRWFHCTAAGFSISLVRVSLIRVGSSRLQICLRRDERKKLGIARAALVFALLLLGISATPVAVQGQEPLNFILILTDDQRLDTLWAMPRVDQLANSGVTFSDAFVTTPICGPSRASILSGGFYAHNTGVLNNMEPNGGVARFDDSEALATLLQGAGYATGFIGKYLNEYSTVAPYIPPGWTVFEAGSNTLFPSYRFVVGSSGSEPSLGEFTGLLTQYGTDYLRDRALAFIDLHAGQPFFLLLSIDAPHYPRTPAPGDEGLFGAYLYRERAYGEVDLSDKPLQVRNVALTFPAIAEERDEIHRNQLRSLQAVDRAVGALADHLELLGLLDRTVIIFTSDNGFLWGEHGLVEKAWPYEESIRVPLVAVVPDITPRVDDHLVAMNLDIPATILELAGVEKATDGMSLVPVLQDPDAPGRGEALIESTTPYYFWGGLRIKDASGDWKYIESDWGPSIELYDLANDPFEEENLSADPSHQSMIAGLSATLAGQKALAIPFRGDGTKTPVARIGEPYSFQLQARGGVTPYTWSVVEGELPAGLSLDPASGLISGVPTQAGSREVLVKVEDSSTSLQTGNPQSFLRWLAFTVVSDCSDGLDNDGDGLTDYPADIGCKDPSWPAENPECSDGVDNSDSDDPPLADWDGAGTGNPDPECVAPWDKSEAPSSPRCGLGAELALLLPPLMWLWLRCRGEAAHLSAYREAYG